MKIKSAIHCLLYAILATVAFTRPSMALDIYVLSGNSLAALNSSTNFGKIDTATGNYTSIVTGLSGGNSVANLAWNPLISKFYVLENQTSGSQNLRTLDINGNLSAPIGTIGQTVVGMVYSVANNTIYALDASNGRTGTIDPSTGAWSTLNSTAYLYASAPQGGRYAMMNGTIYMSYDDQGVFGQFGTIGTTSSSNFTQIGSNDNIFKTMSLATDQTTMFGAYSNGTTKLLYQIDPSTGTPITNTSILSSSGLNSYFYGAGVSTVPEPSTYALGAIATGVMAIAARRRRAKQA